MIEKWLTERAASYQTARIDRRKRQNRHEELADLRDCWRSVERQAARYGPDLRLLRYCLAAKSRAIRRTTPICSRWIVASHGAFFGHLDLMIIGGFSVATWLTEKLSNEVTNRVRATNRRIGERFAQLAISRSTGLPVAQRAGAATRAVEDLRKSAEN